MAERRNPKTLSKNCYLYLSEDNYKHANTHGKKLFGSRSAYIDALISVDRGEIPNLGAWKAPGEAKLIRKSKRKGKKSKVVKADKENAFYEKVSAHISDMVNQSKETDPPSGSSDEVYE